MIHKLHMGSSLPSVKAGKPYKIGTNNDYSDVAFPAGARQCTVCHEQNTGATQANAYLKGNRAACGACHDDVDFATGAHAIQQQSIMLPGVVRDLQPERQVRPDPEAFRHD